MTKSKIVCLMLIVGFMFLGLSFLWRLMFWEYAVLAGDKDGKDVLDDFFTELKRHIDLHVLCDILRSQEFKTARSWVDLSVVHAGNVDFLEKVLAEVARFGKKSGYVYSIDRDLTDWFRGLACQNLPHELAESRANNKAPLPVGYLETERFIAVTYASVRETQNVNVLCKGDLSESAQKSYWSQDSVIKVFTTVPVVTYESLILDVREGLVYVLLDDVKYSLNEQASDILSKFISYVDGDGVFRNAVKPVDMFNAIKSVYSSSCEGIVSDLAFECGTGAVREEKLKQAQLDLRQEIYHVQGTSAVGEIYPYKIQVAWHPKKYSGISSEVLLGIKGRRSNLHRRGGVFRFELLSIGMFSELCFALNRLYLYFDR